MDFFYFIDKNFIDQKHKVHIRPSLREKETPNALPVLLTKQVMLLQINRSYDITGLLTTLTMKKKLLMQKLG